MPPPRLPLRPRFPLPLTRPLPHHRRHLIAPPTSSSGPLLARRSDRALPPLPRPGTLWLKTLPVFLAIITASALCIFNYQKASSSVVSATLYALRTSPAGRRELGDEIYFRDRFPWIWGELNQLQGRIDVRFGVKGTKGRGVMRFRSVRRGRGGFVSFFSPPFFSFFFCLRFFMLGKEGEEWFWLMNFDRRSSRPRNGAWSSRMGGSCSCWMKKERIRSRILRCRLRRGRGRRGLQRLNHLHKQVRKLQVILSSLTSFPAFYFISEYGKEYIIAVADFPRGKRRDLLPLSGRWWNSIIIVISLFFSTSSREPLRGGELVIHGTSDRIV